MSQGCADRDSSIEYRYSCVDKSLLLPFLKSGLCRPLFGLLPRAWPANLLTLFANAALWSALALAFGSPNSGPLRAVVIPVLLLVYLIIDQLDGMQAVATGTSSPLGEFLDHGLDAFNSGVLFLVLVTRFGTAREGLALAALTAVYLAHTFTFDEQLRTGRLFFERIGSVEAVIGAAFLVAVSGSPAALALMRGTTMDGVSLLSGAGGLITGVRIWQRSGAPSRRCLLLALGLLVFAAGVSRLDVPLWRKLGLLTLLGGVSTCGLILARLTGDHAPVGERISAALGGALLVPLRPDVAARIEELSWGVLGLTLAGLFFEAGRALSCYWVWSNPATER